MGGKKKIKILSYTERMPKLIPLGTGDAFSELHYGCCMAVEADSGEMLLIDCPHPVRKMMREASILSKREITPENLSGVVLTHLHADHASGLESLAYWFFFVLGKRLPLYTHPSVAARLWEGHLAAGMEQLLPAVGMDFVKMELESYFDVHFLSETAPVTCGPFSISCRPTIHHIPTFALKVAVEKSVLGHSADTAFDLGLIEWLSEAQLIIHETNYGVHTPYEDLAALGMGLRSKMRLTHYPDNFNLQTSEIRGLEEGRIEEF